MPRIARWVLPDYPLHVVQRGINRGSCFFSDEDYEIYLHYLRASAKRFPCSVHAYCLMTNHVHLLLTPHEHDACGAFMKYVGQCYVQTVNRRFARTGTLWEGRFHSSPVCSDNYVLACYRYIELNPVRAGMVATPAQYPWSSYAANAEGKSNGLLRPHSAYEGLAGEAHQRADSYKSLCSDALPASDIEDIRKAARVGTVIGALRRGPGRPPRSK